MGFYEAALLLTSTISACAGVSIYRLLIRHIDAVNRGAKAALDKLRELEEAQ